GSWAKEASITATEEALLFLAICAIARYSRLRKKLMGPNSFGVIEISFQLEGAKFMERPGAASPSKDAKLPPKDDKLSLRLDNITPVSTTRDIGWADHF